VGDRYLDARLPVLDGSWETVQPGFTWIANADTRWVCAVAVVLASAAGCNGLEENLAEACLRDGRLRFHINPW
jgi:hypothetical protein